MRGVTLLLCALVASPSLLAGGARAANSTAKAACLSAPGCKACDRDDARVCAACLKGYKLNSYGGCGCAAGYGVCVRADAAAGAPPPATKLPSCDADGDALPMVCAACPRDYTSVAAPRWARPECVPKRSPYAVTFAASVGEACEGMAVLAVQSAAQDLLSAGSGATITDIVVLNATRAGNATACEYSALSVVPISAPALRQIIKCSKARASKPAAACAAVTDAGSAFAAAAGGKLLQASVTIARATPEQIAAAVPAKPAPAAAALAAAGAAAGAASLVAAGDEDLQFCKDVCDINALKEPKAPGSPTTDVSKATISIIKNGADAFKTISDWVKDKRDYLELVPWTRVFSLGLAVFNAIDGSTPDNKAAWETYKMDVKLTNLQDTLTCRLNALGADIMGAMDQKTLDDLNAAVDGMQSTIEKQCPVWSCLNFTNLAPSQRNTAVGSNCVYKRPKEGSKGCEDATSWDPKNPKLCEWAEPPATGQGICDPDGSCYSTSITYDSVIADIRAMARDFLSKINDFRIFETVQQPGALLAYAKAATSYALMLQTMILMGADGSEYLLLQNHCEAAAKEMQTRYDFLTSDERVTSIVAKASYCAPLEYNDDRGSYESGIGNDAGCPSEVIKQHFATGKRVCKHPFFTFGFGDYKCTKRTIKEFTPPGGSPTSTGKIKVRGGCSATPIAAFAPDTCPDTQRKMREFSEGVGKLQGGDAKCISCTCDQLLKDAATQLKATLAEQLQPVTEAIAGFKDMAAVLRSTDPNNVQGVYKIIGYPKGNCPGVRS